ncbi:hypothetical protein KPSA3_05320 [Pseudomonas syringae pv. actinidiae]|uniref:Uncharacterized protein n=1 Tax=Pseudomonas syringae pv. actinidiae TaxID=103796 RepID=A0AAN4Q932_PSESF|nr:hypothetical protein KPSA3_05320 [Pseudomonas syringae pv. actinidiae]
MAEGGVSSSSVTCSPEKSSVVAGAVSGSSHASSSSRHVEASDGVDSDCPSPPVSG